MVKTPEQYFEDQEFLSDPRESDEELTEAEKAFLEKYLGLDEADILEKLGIEAPVQAEQVELGAPEAVAGDAEEVAPDVVGDPLADHVEDVAEAVAEVVEGDAADIELEPLVASDAEVAHAVSETFADVVAEAEAAPAVAEEELTDLVEQAEEAVLEVPEDIAESLAEPEEALDASLKAQDEIQLVSFFVGKQEYTTPIEAVQEVVRAVPVTKLPETPQYFAGIVNLRGRVTPLVKLSVLLKRPFSKTETNAPEEDNEEKFIVVCRRKGLQVGLLVHEMATMYRVPQDAVEWSIESRMGGTAEFVTALLRRGEDLIGVVSVDGIVDKLIKKQGT